MSIQSVGLRAYTNALQNFSIAESKMKDTAVASQNSQGEEFANVLKGSLEKVNNLQGDRSKLITSFASGENQNVHELMIAMQKAGLAMNMTAAVRNKVIEAYKELARMQF